MKKVVVLLLAVSATLAVAEERPRPPRVDSVAPAAEQPQSTDPAVIWYDNFDGPAKNYTEASGGFDDQAALGGSGRSMLSHYPKGSRGEGNRKVFFGDSPTGKVVRRGEKFDDVYWRLYVKHQPGWTGGGPDKLSRATSMTSPRWSQAMIAHVWSSGESLTLDPATGVRDGRVVTTRYNDFPNLRWLGNRPVTKFQIHSAEEAGYWVCVEARAKLNTPGEKDGLFQLWIDGRLESERTGLDWRGTYDEHGINAVFLESYWNKGSPVDQTRWIDEFVISTAPIGPIAAESKPTLLRAPGRDDVDLEAWQVEVAADGSEAANFVWRSRTLDSSDRVTVDASNGEFTNSSEMHLIAGKIYYVRARQRARSLWSDWSHWHQPFKVIERE